MGMEGVEAVVRGVTEALQNSLATKLSTLESTLNALYSDAIELPAPASDAYWWFRPDLLPSYPAIIILCLPEVPSGLDLSDGYDFDYAVQIDLVVPADSPLTALILTWRYWRAIKEVLTPTCIPGAHTELQAVDWNQPAWTPEGFSGPVKDIPGLITVQTTERA
jgi:hypothetical protein